MVLSEDQISASLSQILAREWQATLQASVLLGEGVYGRAYGVTFDRFPYRAVIKSQKYPAMGEPERRQLLTLHTYLPDLVPQIYAYRPAETMLGDILIMEWLPGQSYPRPEQFPRPLRASLQGQTVDLLLRLHTFEHQGYGSLDGPFFSRWWDYYGQRVQGTYQAIMHDEQARTYLGSQVLALMDRLLEQGERILDTNPQPRPVLLHGDFCFGNLLFDSQTWRVSGLIDPLDAEWGERELDLVNVINGHIHHFELLNRYREAVDFDARFPLRYWFYQVWKWLFYYVRVQARCREWVLRCGWELEKAMKRHL
jgi:fructosamine-3-kinase